MKYTGERFIPTLASPASSYEHWHRYLYATEFVKDKTVLDIACGEGYGSYILAFFATEVLGIDIDEQTIKYASDKYTRDNIKFLVGSVNDIPVEGEKIFDVIISLETIEHINKECQESLLSEVKRLLKSDGILLISTPNKLLFSDVPKHRYEFHKREFYVEDFQGFLSKHFKNVTLLGQKIYPASFIWTINRENRNNVEFQLKLYKKGFRPVFKTDEKEMLFVIALCSDSNLETPPNSSLIDVSKQQIILKKRLRLLKILLTRIKHLVFGEQ